MAAVGWAKALDLDRAVTNLKAEIPGDWHQDPWGWPELGFLLKKEPEHVYDNCESTGSGPPALLDVPKENWSSRPAVVLNVVDRLTYQALVDRQSVDLIGALSPNVFGWRLPPITPARGQYSHNNKQWEGYRNHLSFLAGLHSVALKTDLVSFFANVDVDVAQAAINDRCAGSAVTKRLCDLIASFDGTAGRSGLPQRSTASAVIANMYLEPLDDVLAHHAQPMPRMLSSKVQYHSFARWMDDIWFFGHDPAGSRRAQMDLQDAAQQLGLSLNFAKTDVLEGAEVAEQALEVEHSAVDDAIDNHSNFVPLEELIDKVLEAKEKASRTSIKFATKRMRDNRHLYKVQDLVQTANRMPHAADAWTRLFKEVFTSESLQDWFLDYASSSWATHEWALAQYVRMFPTSKRPRKPMREFVATAVRNANTGLPLLTVAAQRLSTWDNAEARVAFRDAFSKASTPLARRSLALAALGAGESRSKVRAWLRTDAENSATLAMLESFGWAGPRVSTDYAA